MNSMKLPGGAGRAAGAALLSLAAVAAVALVLLSAEEQEVSLASFCFFGSCKTPPASAEARWRKEAAVRAKRERGILGAGVPCFLGGGCDPPPSSRIRKWKRSVEKQKNIKRMEDARRLKKWGAPAPAKVVKSHKRHRQLTDRQRQRHTSREIMLKIQQRARFLSRKSTQLSAAKVSVHASKLKTQLSKYPTARKKLKSILTKLSVAESTKVAAGHALTHAQALTKVANKARADVLTFEKTVTASIAKAKADEKAHQLALRRVQFLVKRSEQAQATYNKMKTKSAFDAVTPKKLRVPESPQKRTKPAKKPKSEKKAPAKKAKAKL